MQSTSLTNISRAWAWCSTVWVSVFQGVAVWDLTWRGRWLDVDRSCFNHGQHSGLQRLDDDRLGLQGSWCMSQRHSCNQRFWLDGNLRANLNRPLDWLSLFGWCVCMRVCQGMGWKEWDKNRFYVNTREKLTLRSGENICIGRVFNKLVFSYTNLF